MSIGTSGSISFANLNTELGNSSTAQISLADARVIGSVPTSESVSVSQMYGGRIDVYDTASTRMTRPTHTGAWGGSVHGGYGSTVVITTEDTTQEIRVYDFSSGTPSLMWQKDSPSSNSSWGISAAVTPHWVIVGAPFEDNTYSNDGSVYWYRRSSGLLEKEVNAPNVGGGTVSNANFGRYVVANDDFSAIVAINERTLGAYYGRLYIYRNNGLSSSSTYTDSYYFTSSTSINNIGVDRGLAMNDSHVFVGDNDNGRIYVFSIDYATGTLTLEQTISNTLNSFMGFKLYASDNWLCTRSGGTPGLGVAVYRKTGTHTYSYYDLISSPETTPSNFGQDIQINGNLLVVSDYTHGVNPMGKVYVFDIPSGVLLQTILNPNPGTGDSDRFGDTSTIFAGTSLVVGAPYEDIDGTNQGAVYYWGNPKATVALPNIRDDSYLNLTATQYSTSNTDFCTSNIYFNSDGSIEHRADTSSKQVIKLLGHWLDNAVEKSVAGQDFWIRFTNLTTNNGSYYGGTPFNSWLSLVATRVVAVSKTTGVTEGSAAFKVEIATDSVGRNIIATQNYYIVAKVNVTTSIPSVTLTGTSASPITWNNNDLARISTSNGYTGFKFYSNGDMSEMQNNSSFNTPRALEWYNGTPYTSEGYQYYIDGEWSSRTGLATEYTSSTGGAFTGHKNIINESPQIALLNNIGDPEGQSSGTLSVYITQQSNYPPITIWDEGVYEVETYKEPTFSISNRTMSETSTAGSSCYAGFRIEPNGNLYQCGPGSSELTSGGTLITDEWADGTPQDPNGYWVYRTTSGTWNSTSSFNNGTQTQFLNNENCYVFRSSSSPGTTSVSGTLAIYRQNNSAQYQLITSGTITLSATVPTSGSVSLSGTTSSPNQFDINTANFGAFQTAFAGIQLQSDGDLVKYSNSVQPNTNQWFSSTPSQTYYVRVTSYATSSNPSTGSVVTNGGSSQNTWLALSSTRSWYVSASTSGSFGIVSVFKTWKVEISTNSSGSPIIATGYYDTDARVENGF